MNRRGIAGIAALAAAGLVAVLALTPVGGATVRHVSALIAPTSKSAVADVNAFNNWNVNDCGSTCSRDGFKNVTHFDTGIYCLSGRTSPDASMLKVTPDAEHSNSIPEAIMWDRSAPNCGSGQYEVYTYCLGVPDAPSPNAPDGPLCDDVAFYAEAFKRA
jgi:hypothetical protein